MKILWICNFMLPAIAAKLNLGSTNKEGWVAGLASVIQERRKENSIELAVAFPVSRELDGCQGEVLFSGAPLYYYGFYEDTANPQIYDQELEGRLQKIMTAFKPDVVHCFGTEFSHTLAAARTCPDKQKLLIGIQGLCSVYADAFMANLPTEVIHSVTFRDCVKKDTIIGQQRKYVVRGEREIEAIKCAGHITGRTAWDLYYSKLWNPKAVYHKMNETLRPIFYEGKWEADKCVPHRIFLSQGDYPIKGLHYMLLALPAIREKYPDVTVHVAGNSIVKYETLKDKIKISAYGKYLRSIMIKYKLMDLVKFMGSLTGEQMKEQYLAADTFVCCSSIENSPNSLGEAMILGVPCVSARVGGIDSLFVHETDGLLFDGFEPKEKNCEEAKELKHIVKKLSEAVIRMWDDRERAAAYGCNAKEHARKTHDKEVNYNRMMEIYTSIVAGAKQQ